MSELEYEVKFKRYDGNEYDPKTFIEAYEKLYNDFKLEGSVVSRVNSYFFEGYISLVKGDLDFYNKRFREAFVFYTEAIKMLTRFSNSRNVTRALDILASRLLSRSNGLAKLCEGFLVSKLKIRDSLFVEALQYFNEEVSKANEMKEQISSYAAFSRASFAQSQILLTRAEALKDTNSANAKRNLLQAKNSIRQAAFITSAYRDYLLEIEEKLEEITRDRLLNKAEYLGDLATKESEMGNYDEAIINYRKASAFYRRASIIATDGNSRRLLLSTSTILEASILEAEGNKFMKVENEPEIAGDRYEKAARAVDKAIALIGRFGKESLITNFKCQRDYYQAMSAFSSAVFIFDNDQYEEAKVLFVQSDEEFRKVLEIAKQIDNEVIIRLATEISGSIKTYISMCETLM